MSTDALREFFLPLEKWLKKENKKNGVRVGWDHNDSKVMCSDQITGQTTGETSGETTTDETPDETTGETQGVTTDLTLEETTDETTDGTPGEIPNLTDNSCEDVRGKWKNCHSWGKRGYCTLYFMEPYMKKNCKKTCGFC